MTKLEQAAQQALEALRYSCTALGQLVGGDTCFRMTAIGNNEAAMEKMQEALAEQVPEGFDYIEPSNEVLLLRDSLNPMHRHRPSNLDVLRGLARFKAEQAEQEPEVWYCPDCGTLGESQVKCCPDWIRSRKVPKNFAITCKTTFDRYEQAEQRSDSERMEPVAWVVPDFGFLFPSEDAAQRYLINIESDAKPTPCYAAPVRTKDLTDDEIVELYGQHNWWSDPPINFARAVIAADREKNK